MDVQQVGPRTYTVRSESDPEKEYTVDLSPDLRTAVCNCQGDQPAIRNGHLCKHSREVLDMTNNASGVPEDVTDRAMVPHDGAGVRDGGALVPVAPDATLPTSMYPALSELRVMIEMANFMGQGVVNLLPAGIDNPQKMFLVLYAGYELGVGPMTAARHFFVVNNKIEPDTQLMLGLARAKDPTFDIQIITPPEDRAKQCEVVFHRAGAEQGVSLYTLAMADKAGLTRSKKDQNGTERNPWINYTDTMLTWGAVKRGLRIYAPDLINNIRADVRGAAGIIDAEQLLDSDDPDNLLKPTMTEEYIENPPARAAKKAPARRAAKSTRRPTPARPAAPDARPEQSASLLERAKNQLGVMKDFAPDKWDAFKEVLGSQFPHAFDTTTKAVLLARLTNDELQQIIDTIADYIKAQSVANPPTQEDEGTDDAPADDEDGQGEGQATEDEDAVT